MDREFRAGDVVRIRDWDDMKREYGVDSEGDIDCPNGVFITQMRKYCGEIFTITGVDDEEVLGHGLGNWWITTDMIELYYKDREDFNDDTSDIESYLAKFNCHSSEIA